MMALKRYLLALMREKRQTYNAIFTLTANALGLCLQGESKMNQRDAENILHDLFASLTNPAIPTENLASFFTRDYIQIVDGETLDLDGFLQHAATLRNALIRAEVSFEKIIAQDDTIADIHIVRAEKKNGDHIRVKVIAFYTLRDGRISRIEELTHLLDGKDEDRDLGSRIDVPE
ncbi:hypothetical protein CSC3H3_07970 [Thalassospira marina]|uniref:SnoaL-like domain-containing protein n=2 Tax=Thalassospira marina TaxID=2048283 RepID=A0ABN5FD22_9PROT|nr:hypothetical protein CSC3H3_07970 [Thalassospira marina]